MQSIGDFAVKIYFVFEELSSSVDGLMYFILSLIPFLFSSVFVFVFLFFLFTLSFIFLSGYWLLFFWSAIDSNQFYFIALKKMQCCFASLWIL